MSTNTNSNLDKKTTVHLKHDTTPHPPSPGGEANWDADLTLSWWPAAFRQTGRDLRSGGDLHWGGGGGGDGSSSSTSSSTTMQTRLTRSDSIRQSALTHPGATAPPLPFTRTDERRSLSHMCQIKVQKSQQRFP